MTTKAMTDVRQVSCITQTTYITLVMANQSLRSPLPFKVSGEIQRRTDPISTAPEFYPVPTVLYGQVINYAEQKEENTLHIVRFLKGEMSKTLITNATYFRVIRCAKTIASLGCRPHSTSLPTEILKTLNSSTLMP